MNENARPELDERILAYVTEHPRAPTAEIVAHVGARRQHTLAALRQLALSGRLNPEKGARRSRRWLSAASGSQRFPQRDERIPDESAHDVGARSRDSDERHERHTHKESAEPTVGFLPVSEYVECHAPYTPPDQIRAKLLWYVGHLIAADELARLVARAEELYSASTKGAAA